MDRKQLSSNLYTLHKRVAAHRGKPFKTSAPPKHEPESKTSLPTPSSKRIRPDTLPISLLAGSNTGGSIISQAPNSIKPILLRAAKKAGVVSENVSDQVSSAGQNKETLIKKSHDTKDYACLSAARREILLDKDYRTSPFYFIDRVIESPYTEEFVYLRSRGPYDLEIVSHQEIDPNDYFTMSRSGVTHIYKGDTEFTSLDQWEREYFLYTRMMQVDFFARFRLWKTFYYWKKLIRRQKTAHCQKHLANNLFILNDNLRDPLVDLRIQCYNVSQWTPNKIDIKHTYSLDEYVKTQDKQRNVISSQLQDLNFSVKGIVLGACAKDLNSFLLKNGFRRGEESKFERFDEDNEDYHKKTTHAERAAIRTECRKLTKYIRLSDYFVMDTLVTLSLERTSELLDILRRPSQGPIPEVFHVQQRDKTSASLVTDLLVQGTNGSKETQTPIFVTNMILGDDIVIDFTPPLIAYQESIVTCIFKAVQAMMTPNRLITDEEFLQYTQVNLDDTEEDANIENDLGEMVFREQNFINMIQAIKTQLKLAFEDSYHYSQEFAKVTNIYHVDINTDILALKNNGVDQFESSILKYKNQIAMFEDIPIRASVGIIQVDSSQYKELLIPAPRNCLKELSKLLPTIAAEKTSELSEVLQVANERLAEVPANVEEFVKFKSFLQQTHEHQDELETQFDFLNSLTQLMQVHKIPQADHDKTNYEKLLQMKNALKTATELSEFSIDEKTGRFVKELETQIPVMKKEISDLAGEIKVDMISNPLSNVEEVIEYLNEREQRLIILEERSKKFKHWQKELGMTVNYYAELVDLKVDLDIKQKLWVSLRDWKQLTEEWMETKFEEIKVEDVLNKVQIYAKVVQLALRRLKDNPVVEVLKSRVEEFQLTMPVVVDLRNPHLVQDRHWKEIQELIDYDIHNDKNFVLGKLIELKVMEHQEKIRVIAYRADQEAAQRELLDTVISMWEDCEFELKPFKDSKDIFILGSLDDIIGKLDDSLVHSNTILASNYCDFIRDEVLEWRKKLLLFQDTLDEWIKCQKTWMYFYNIFAGPEISKQLPDAYADFVKVTKSWKDIMRRTSDHPNVMHKAGGFQALREILLSHNATLERINKKLTQFLEMKRRDFPRFFFLSKDDLLEVLAESKNVHVVQRHMPKFFDSIHHLDFGSDPGNLQIEAMLSIDGERVPLYKMRAKGAVEAWLSSLENGMAKAVRRELKAGLIDFERTPQRVTWLMQKPGQVVLTVSKIIWTRTCENALQSARPIETLRRWLQFQRSQLTDLTRAVRGDITELQRKKIISLITIDVHSAEVTEQLIDSAADTLDNFDWQKCLRFYWDKEDDSCTVKQNTALFRYGYEYLGTPTRLVITPLTDRCWMTLTGALQLKLGGSPQGPAGTGKTESTKDLAKALGIYCVVYNGSEQFECKTMGDLISGVAQSGVWMCVDEFNRINIEVLSVIALQVRQIHEALVSQLNELQFEGRMIRLKSSCGIFITMNPDYAARVQLPDNLTVLFRPVSMMIPDYWRISRVMLYAQGFETADVLAQKMCKLYKLSSEQLSQQKHYDFGMRAHKSVLVIAGALRRSEPDLKEETLLIRAVCNSNLPKFNQEDIPLFNAIVQDLFPEVFIPSIDYGKIQSSIEQSCQAKSLQVLPNFSTKALQLYETLQVRFGVMVIGPPGSGKSQVRDVLADSLTSLYTESKDPENSTYKSVHTYVINPKCVSLGELYGQVHEVTQEWQDGLVSSIIKKIIDDETEDNHWLVFDGPVDSFWIENMNSALDDNMTLCLPNGTRIKLTDKIRLLFETEDLMFASPATVSRCGMVYISDSDISYQPYIQSWMQKFLPPEMDLTLREHLIRLFESKVGDGLNFVKQECVEPIPTCDIAKVTSLCTLFQSLFSINKGIDFRKPPEDILPLMEHLFVFSYLWSIGGNIDDASHIKFDKFIKDKFPEIRFPKDLLFDYYVDINRHIWLPWTKIVPNFTFNPEVPFNHILVPTVNTVRYSFFLQSLLAIDRSAFLTGVTGVGKSATITDMFNRISGPQSILPVTLFFSAQTKSHQVQQLIESRLERKRDILLGAPTGKKIVVFVDDVNMPSKDEFDTQPPIELLRQFQDYKGFYDRKKIFWKDLVDTSLMCAAAPAGGGRNRLSPRFVRHFHLVCVKTPSDGMLKHIFGAIMQGFLLSFSADLHDLVTPIVNSTVNLFKDVISEMKPTPSKSHYTFNLRDISKVFQGILLMQPDDCLTSDTMIHLWIHECMRMFHDRLASKDDRIWLTQRIIYFLNKNFAMSATHQQIFEQQTILFGDFLNPTEKHYVEMADYNRIAGMLDEQLIHLSLSDMNIVFFDDAINHLARIARILRQPRGNALLVGVGGSGKQTMAKLAAAISGIGMFRIEARKTYTYKDFREDIKHLLTKAGGGDAHQIVFILSESQISDDRFLEDINSILNSGEVPNLFDIDEERKILDELLPIAKSNGINENRDSLWALFVDRVSINLHIILCMSPVGHTFRDRIRMFPSLVNCTTIDWYSMWPAQALHEVAQRYLENLVVPSEDVRKGIVSLCVKFHQSMDETCDKFYAIHRRKVYTTPKSYLDLINLYLRMLAQRRAALNATRIRLMQGLQKLHNTNRMIVELEAKLKELQPKYKQAAVQTESLLKKLEIDQEEARKIRTVVQNEEAIVKKDQEEVARLAAEAENDLTAVKPFLDEANEAVSRLDRQDVAYMRSYPNPPYNIRLVAEAICILLKEDPEWSNAQRVFQNPRFLSLLTGYDKNNLDPVIVQKLQKKYIEHPLFTEEKMASASQAALSMCKWVRAMVEYDRVLRIVHPKQVQLEKISKQLEEATTRLQSKQNELRNADEAVTALRLKCDVTMKEKNKYNALCAQTRNRLSRASKLTSGLAEESIRWSADVEKLEHEIKNLVGDVFLCAACVSYIGPFTGPYRRDLVDSWKASLLEQKIPCSDDFSLVNTLGNPVEIRDWHIKNLPTDTVSIDSAIIVHRSDRWPLLIDPQGQAEKWIRELYKNKLITARASDPALMRTVDSAIASNRLLLIEDVVEELDPSLDAVLLKKTNKEERSEGGGTGFQFFLCTKLSNPHFLPEVSIKTNIINFTVTHQALVDQLLGDVVCKERIEIEEKKNELMTRIADDKKQLQVIEERIVTYLSRGPEYIVDDDNLINQLQSSKDTATLITERVKQAEINQKIIEQTRDQYVPVAERGAVIYFILPELVLIDPMYQFSLNYFKRMFNLAIDQSEANPVLEDRLKNLMQTITETIYSNICRGLFETHKMIFAFLVATRIVRASGQVSQLEWDYFLRGACVQETSRPNPYPDLFSTHMWRTLIGIDDMVPAFNGLVVHIERNAKSWQKYIGDENAEDGKTIPAPWNEKLTEFQKLILIKCFHEELIPSAVFKFLSTTLGPYFSEFPRAQLQEVFKDTDPKTPVIFVLSPGADPLNMIERFAHEIRFWNKVKLMSLGKGMAPTARALIESAQTKGQWVVLQNCHLAPSFLPELEKIVEQIHENESQIHEDFRLWLTSKPCSEFPVAILQNSIKITNEPPKGIRANLSRTYSVMSHMEEKKFESSAKPHEWKKLLFGLSIFHAVVQERSKFGPLGWNISYHFNDADFEASSSVIYDMLQNSQSIHWDALWYVIGEINYGGRVTDEWDRRCLKTILSKFLLPDIFNESHRFTKDGIYSLPPNGSIDSYRQFIVDLPIDDTPEVFGMNSNANTTHKHQEATNIFNTLLKIQPRMLVTGSGKSTDQLVEEIVDNLQAKIPADLSPDSAHKDLYEVDGNSRIDSLSTFLFQEVSRYNKLLNVIRTSLTELQQAILGEVVMSPQLDHMYTSILNSKLPSTWVNSSYPSLKSLLPWIEDLIARIAFMNDWLTLGKPSCFWLGGLFYPHAFFTAILQNYSRKHIIAVDKLSFQFQYLDNFVTSEIKEPPSDGVLISGLCLVGAHWESKRKIIVESIQGELLSPLPIIHFLPTPDYRPSPKDYNAPLYRTTARAGVLSTTGESTNFLLSMSLPSAMQSSHWILQGTAVISQRSD